MIDSVRAEIDYRQERVRHEVAAVRPSTGKGRGERSARTSEDRPAAGRRASRRPRPAVQYARPRSLSAQPGSGGTVC